jgi:capsular exopolysaccharide synthesis family protein
MLHANVQYLPIVDKCKKIAITSAVSGEGKTYIALNLSITLATNSDKKVLLVDMDMRAPRIKKLIKSKVVRAKKFAGLSEYLAGIDKEPNILNTDIPNFDVLFSGKESSNSIGLINSPKIVTLFEELSEKYDYIIIDTPPVNIVTDALLLSGKINGYILSTRSNYSNINSLNIAIENIKSVGGEIFGLVLTELNVKSAKNTKYKYPIGDYN